MAPKKAMAKKAAQALGGKKAAQKVIKPAVKRAPRKTDVKGLREAKKATTMTSQEWKQHQVGMKEKWPQPEYMKNPWPKGHTSYRDETFELVTRFQAETKLEYRPHAKAPGSKSHVRYERYGKARTVGEALKLGAWPVDWCWDIERGYIRVTGGLREDPIDVVELRNDAKLSLVDEAVMRWYKKELCKKYGLSHVDLVTDKLGGESILMRAHRLVAQREAKKIMADCKQKKRTISESDVLTVLGYWGFARNVSRLNVMQKDVTWVWSDTLGLLRDRTGDIHLTKATHAYPDVVQVLAGWLTNRLPATEAQDFRWTSFNLNKDYNGRIHRDGNNFGPSMISAFGDYSGGALNYYPHDDGKIDLELLQSKTEDKAAKLDLKNGLALFNGNSAHSVDEFKGQRFSVVYFTLGCHGQMKAEDRERLQSLGVAAPKADEDPYKIICAPKGERSGRRYGAVATPSRKGARGAELPAYRYWSKASLDAKTKKRKA